jgi:hypothetical protein
MADLNRDVLGRLRTWRWLPFLCATAIFTLNAWICRDLFGLEFNSNMASIESAYMSISRWAMSNWSDLTWFPLWYTGSPFRSVYQPGLHLTVAALASVGGFTVQHAYHMVTALAYCAGAAALFFLCFATTKLPEYGLTAALLYSLISPTCLLSSAVRAEAGGWLSPRRYQILAEIGLGPQTAALALLPLAILALHAAVTLRRRVWIALAPFALAAVVLTNWPGTVSLSVAILAYCLSRLGSSRPLHWPTLIGVGITTYLIASPWIPPSTIGAVVKNAQQSDGTRLGIQQLVAALSMIAVLFALHAVFRKFGCDRVFRFFFYFALIAGVVSLGALWFDWHLLPQARRFELDFDMATAAVVAWVLMRIVQKLPRRWGVALVAILLTLGIAQARTCRRYARRHTHSIDVTTTIEYKMSKGFETNLSGQRVFAPGNVSLWMNMFTDVPQMNGCCDQGVPSYEHRIAVYTIYSGQNAGPRDAEISTLWLRAYGANAIGTTGPHSTEYYRPFANWRKFDGVLPEIWRDGENIIYRVPRKSPDPVRVIARTAVTSRAPVNGLDIEQLQPFADALEDRGTPAADFRWINRHEALIHAKTRPGDVIFLQISWSPGWRAIDNGTAAPIHPDPLGMMYVEPRTTGSHQIRLIYGRDNEATFTRILQLLGFCIIAANIAFAVAGRNRRVIGA